MGGASAPTPFARVAANPHRAGSKSVGPEGPPTFTFDAMGATGPTR
ncbi:DUF6053 domain-containing protein [Lysobacter yananisis]